VYENVFKTAEVVQAEAGMGRGIRRKDDFCTFPDVATVYQEWVSRQLKLATEDAAMRFPLDKR
jgi:hypothetical protein